VSALSHASLPHAVKNANEMELENRQKPRYPLRSKEPANQDLKNRQKDKRLDTFLCLVGTQPMYRQNAKQDNNTGNADGKRRLDAVLYMHPE
jgi:hypothetical protein